MTPTRWLVVLVSFGATIGISLYLIVSSWPEDGATVLLPASTHLLAFGAVIADLLARATKISLSAASLHIPLRFGTALRTSLGGDFGAAITPARSGAEPARFFILAQARVRAAQALLVLFTELFLELLSLVAVAGLLSALFRGSGRLVGSVAGVVGGYAVLMLVGCLVAWTLAQRGASGPPPRWARAIGFHSGRWRVVQRALRHIHVSIDGLRRANLPLMSAALLFSIVHVLLRLAILPIIVLSLDRTVDATPLVLWPLVFLYGGALAPAPGGGGVVEIAFRAALGGDIPADHFAPALIWWRFYSFYLYTLLGAIVAGGAVLRALRPGSTEPRLLESGPPPRTS